MSSALLIVAGAALPALVVRLAVAAGRSLRELARTRREALTDPLTGLGNRSALIEDLNDLLSAGARGFLIAFDLDGFKQYNDVFGHPAGDELLARFGRRLAGAVATSGSAYRPGGDEFCAIVDASRRDLPALVQDAAHALSAQTERFRVAPSYGVVALRAEAGTPERALELADQRLYRVKDRRRGRSSGRQGPPELPGRPLGERVHGSAGPLPEGAGLARELARAYGLAGEALELVVRTAQLEGGGEGAVPAETVVGQGPPASAQALAPVARLVRATRERFDGTGPDGLAGHEIPLAARIVAVCQAYDSLTSHGAAGSRLSPRAACEELRAAGGKDFDPEAVTKLCALVCPGSPEPALSEAGTP